MLCAVRGPVSGTVDGVEVDAVMNAARALVGVAAASFAAVEEQVTLPQLRVLVIADSDEPLTLPRVAAELGVHASNAARMGERLVVAGLLDRRDNPADRRQVLLTLTEEGRALLTTVMDHRRASIEAVLGQLAPAERGEVAAALLAFGDAARVQPLPYSRAFAWA